MRGTDLEEENRRLKKELAIAQEERDILKSCGHLLQNTEMKYRFIREHTGTFRVETMCRVLKVSRTGYYRWLKRPVSQRRSQDEIIKEQIVSIYNKSRKTYGSPRNGNDEISPLFFEPPASRRLLGTITAAHLRRRLMPGSRPTLSRPPGATSVAAYAAHWAGLRNFAGEIMPHYQPYRPVPDLVSPSTRHCTQLTEVLWTRENVE
ncbi:hypothetical protein V3F56_01595 [Moorellaceae bacterium AZ2]